MTTIDIVCSIRPVFPLHRSVEFEYHAGYDFVTDMINYEVMLLEEPAFNPLEEYTFKVTSDAMAFEFVGILYKVTTHNSSTHVTLTFMNRHYAQMFSCVPLYGKGNASDIIKSFYAKAGFKTGNIFVQDQSLTNIESLILEKDIDIAEGISYVKARAVCAAKGYLVSAVIGEDCYIKNLTGKNTNLGDPAVYHVMSIADERQSIVIAGSNAIGVLTNADKAKPSSITTKNNAVANNYLFYQYTNPDIATQFATVAQRRLFYHGYRVTLKMPYWGAFIGREFTVSKDNVLAESTHTEIFAGTYFVFNQVFHYQFKSNIAHCELLAKLTKDI